MPLSKETSERGALGKLLKSQSQESALRDEALGILNAEWANICALAQSKKLKDWIDDKDLIRAVHDSINNSRRTFRYVVPTQLVAKMADSSLDARCLQSQRGGRGAFDARSIAKYVIAEFDQRNNSVLGGSEDPYVSNPVRVPELSVTFGVKRRGKDKISWDQLRLIVETVEERNNSEFTTAIFRQALTEIYKRLSTVRVVYPVPRRVSLKKCVELVHTYISAQKSGGDRLLALSSALFSLIGRRFGLYAEVRRGKITSADEPSGMLADLECVTQKGRIVLAVEVKDRQITIAQIKAKLRTIKERQVSEVFFVAQGMAEAERSEIQALIEKEFAGGQNIYISDLGSLGAVVFSIFGEDGRRDFLDEVKNQLESYKSEIMHRRDWASLLESL